jgi:hypothetical protein
MERGELETLAGKAEPARSDWSVARDRLEDLRRSGNDSGFVESALGITYAELGDKDQALRLVRSASGRDAKDAFKRANARIALATVETIIGESDAALADLEASLREPGGVALASVKLDAKWDPLRSNPRFQKLLAGVGT